MRHSADRLHDAVVTSSVAPGAHTSPGGKISIYDSGPHSRDRGGRKAVRSEGTRTVALHENIGTTDKRFKAFPIVTIANIESSCPLAYSGFEFCQPDIRDVPCANSQYICAMGGKST